MVVIDEILEKLDEIKEINDKIKYLEELMKKINDKDLIADINDILIELKYPEENSRPTRFSMPETQEVEEVQERRLENIVSFEKDFEEKEVKQKEYFDNSIQYDNRFDGSPFVNHIRKNLETKGLIRNGEFLSDDKMGLIRDEIQKYAPGMNEERLNEYVNIINEPNKMYESEHVPVSIMERLDNELNKEKKYIHKMFEK